MSIANIYFPTFLLGILVHFVLFYSAFDVYFSSPLVRNARPQLIGRGSGVAKRLVVFSADGLRSRSFYEHPEESKFLHGLIRNKKAAFGISRSHVPTESRPGHVAIFAGFYEDVSAVTRGWKYSPVEFDHVFNHSTQSWLFGSPDIVPLFGEIPQAKMAFYSASEEKFFSDEASGLDQWVFTKMSELLQSNSTELDVEQIIFFLHLLGLDTNGHGFKPHSHQTVYILCGDHGMSDFGSHGSGTDDEILTPLVVWGAGIRTSGVNQIINQIDLAPLQSALLNIPIPVNSMGVLPLHFIDASDKYKYQAGCGNLKQIRDALIFYHRYHRRTLGIAISSVFVTWNAFLLILISRSDFSTRQHDIWTPSRAFRWLIGIEVFLAVYQFWQFSHLIYIVLPVYLCSLIWNLLDHSIYHYVDFLVKFVYAYLFKIVAFAYELAFLVLYIVLLYSYTQIANSTQLRISQSKYKQTSLNAPFEELEWWRTLIMLVLIEVAFFGVGNLSSLNSFNPSFIRHFVTTFSPFTMAILLILKVFFFCIRDEGSWLEIGLTISHYSICLAMAVIVFALLNLSKTVMFAFEQTHLLKRKFDEDDKFS
ncbi:GPI ethanolamine phosphate transferase 1 [Aphelenchoides besseyi]|nr:GPI ethanolamine phosphate transferase 1 [Aphelenchoides besseyi]